MENQDYVYEKLAEDGTDFAAYLLKMAQHEKWERKAQALLLTVTIPKRLWRGRRRSDRAVFAVDWLLCQCTDPVLECLRTRQGASRPATEGR
jgi:hypothetical protein